jgi:hypothetical protein
MTQRFSYRPENLKSNKDNEYLVFMVGGEFFEKLLAFQDQKSPQ